MAERRPGGDAVEWTAVLDVIAAVAAVEHPEEFGPVAMEALADVVAFDSASYNEVDTGAGRATFATCPSDWNFGSADVEGFPLLVQENPILQYQEATGDGSAHRISDFLTSDQMHDLELYRRVYAPLGVEFQVAFALATKEPLVVAFALNRGQLDFDERDLAVLDVLRPHLVQAYRNVQALGALRGIEDALAGVGKGVVVLGRDGAEHRVPGWAQRALTEHFGPASRGGLPDAVTGWLARQRRPLLDDGQPRIRQPLASGEGDRRLVVRFVPGVGGQPDVLVLDEREPGRELDELGRLGLTRREAEILLLVTRGESTTAAARRLGITAGTVSKHLQHIYRKLGVQSRTAAVAAATDAIFSVG